MPEARRASGLTLVIIALALVGAAAGGALYQWQRQGARAQAAGAADLYAATIADADGKPQPLSRWRGRVLVVNFWATWCAPCVAEMPALDRLQQEYAGRNVAIVGFGTEDAAQVRAFRERLGLHMVLLAGGFDALAIARNLGDQEGVLPYTAVFSTQGELLHTQLGDIAPEKLRAWLDEALKAQPGRA
jgi:thiol-disulfide isomerase/thioredoxin